MEFVIEKDVPIPPPAHSKHHELKRMCEGMEVGDSVLLADKEGHTAANIIRHISDQSAGGNRVKRKATTRKEGDNRRVWRIE